MSKNDFLENLKTVDDNKLLEVIENAESYDPLAVEIAIEIAKNRKLLSNEQIKELEIKLESKWYYEIKGERKGPVSENKIRELFKNNVIERSTLVWRQGYDNWTEFSACELKEKIATNVPPPMIGSRINNTYIWLLAFSPLITIILNIFYAGTFNKDLIGASWIVLVVNILLCVLDEGKLKRAGYNTSKFAGWFLILIPVYMFKRAKH